MKRSIALLLCVVLLWTLAPAGAAAKAETVYELTLESQGAGNAATHRVFLDGQAVPEYDYTWHADPEQAHEEVKNSPAEYHTGTAPSGNDRVYIAHDIVYYPEADQSKFRQVSYDGETEWVRMYEAPGYESYIFSTLPAQRTGFPSQMMHSPEEAYQNAVLHITQPGTYRLTGTWHGQIWVDLGEDAFDDPACKVTLILNGVDICCTVAPGVVFYRVYECDNAWEDREEHSHTVGTQNAGANVILADGTVNNVSGTNVFRILKTKYKDNDSSEAYPAQKKAWKMDGAFYAYQSMNIAGEAKGTGVLNIESGNEGLNSELHLTVNGGNVNIFSQDDGINVNEDDVSTLTVNGGSLHICAGLGAEGDGIDSNGYIVINGGTVITAASPMSDSGLDSDCGSFVNGGTVVALGAAMDWAESDETGTSTQGVLNMQFAGSQSADEAIILTDETGKVVFAYDGDKDEVAGTHARSYQGAIISAPTLEIGETYSLFVGGDVQGTEVSGVYDAATVTSFTGAVQQCYGGNSLGGFGGGRPGGQGGQGDQRPGGNRQPPQDGKGPEGQRPDGTPPEGFQGGNGFGGGFGGGGWGQAAGSCTGTADFCLTQQVNAFSGVADYRHDLQQTEEGSYTCTVCGRTFADDQASAPISQPERTEINWVMILGVALAFFAAATVGLSITLIVTRKKKQ